MTHPRHGIRIADAPLAQGSFPIRREAARAAIGAGLSVTACLMPGAVWAQDEARVVGLWKLVSYEVEARADGTKLPAMGERPTGYVIFTPEKRVFFILTGEGRKPAESDAQRAALLQTLVSYTGRYRLDGDKWTTSVDVAWDPKWIGTEQTRSFTLEGDRLQVLTPWRVMPNWADRGETRSIVTFERAKE
ncbi:MULTISPECIES: lipocalin-like domain-containing protein [Methylobacterium]|uniref:Lipocalin-like domain-containing protein n=4 Tax=Pseudomonadota TaxID=1224 RepID=A0ABQ4SRQ7_9HYPH|nr:hypothetical protein AwMethylo_03860 [Methylobacterium sp.]GJE05895.1 hypothetical protein AOPFMNJM_1201 [Methylobacterium jeotgali]